MSEKSPKDIKNTCKTNIYKFRANSKKAQQVNPSPFKSAQVPWTFFFFSKLQGGMKAVVWTDAFQAIIMVAGMLTVIIVVRSELLRDSETTSKTSLPPAYEVRREVVFSQVSVRLQGVGTSVSGPRSLPGGTPGQDRGTLR